MMTLDDTYFMKQALIEAGKAAERGEVPVGAVVVCKERIIARAHNLTETLNDVTAHAEMQAITAAANVLGGKYLNECTLRDESSAERYLNDPCETKPEELLTEIYIPVE